MTDQAQAGAALVMWAAIALAVWAWHVRQRPQPVVDLAPMPDPRPRIDPATLDVRPGMTPTHEPGRPPRSMHVDEPGYNHAVGCHLVVTLDGQPAGQVLGYDIDMGLVIRLWTHPLTGQVAVNRLTGEVKRERVRGKVDVGWCPTTPASVRRFIS